MKKMKKFLSAFLAAMFVIGSLSGLLTVSVSAVDAGLTPADKIDYSSYTSMVYRTPEEKLSIMTPYLESDEYTFYMNPYSGEVALQKRATGEIVFSNPYDVSASTGSLDTKKQLMSQIVVQYVDNGESKTMYSFEEASLRDQVIVKNIKNGVRVEYVLGLEQSRKLVPRWISETRFEEMISSKVLEAFGNDVKNFYYHRFVSFYDLKSLAKMPTAKARQDLLKEYPICSQFNIYVFATNASATELNWVENYIKLYCPDYTFEEMTKDHKECGYNESEDTSPVFKMALEYSLEQDGLSVKLPANGLRYDSSKYTLKAISVLPYMGAGNSRNDGYLFYPDGSGALFDFDTVDTRASTNIRGKVYGIDYAYHTISGKFQQQITTPVFGLVEEQEFYTYSYTRRNTEENATEDETYFEDFVISRSVKSLEEIEEEFNADFRLTLQSDIKTSTRKTGLFAVIESGESLAEIEVYRAGALSNYNTIRTYFNPRPSDEYTLSGGLSVTDNSSWTVVSDRKYNGNIAIKYMILSDPQLASDAKIFSYEPSYLGMAEAYRDYLIAGSVLSPLTNAEVSDDIPLYIESFGSISATDQILSVPVTVQKPLTTFENVQQIYDDLNRSGISNVNFRLTGFANGGLYYTVPGKLSWDSTVGGKSGFESLVKYAQQVENDGGHLGLYPDFDFVYVMNESWFDGLSLKKHASRTIDGRYASKRAYMSSSLGYQNYFQFALSPAYYSEFYTKLSKNYNRYGLNTISVGSLGSSLNSDFEDNDPYNREDNKTYTIEAFRYLSNDQKYTVMTDVGNSYVWQYADHLLNVTLDSSRYIKASNSIPFLGIVLHGYMQFAGTPLNMEGDMEYAKLKAIENGASLYFTLSYQNTDLLKEDPYYSKYYSVRYDIWKDDVISLYQEMNSVLADVQLKNIINHEFLTGIRVLDMTELSDLINQSILETEEAERNAIRDGEVSEIQTISEILAFARDAVSEVERLKSLIESRMGTISRNYQNITSEHLPNVIAAKAEYDKRLASSAATASDIAAALNAYDLAVATLRRVSAQIITFSYNVRNYYRQIEQLYSDVADRLAYIEAKDGISETLLNEVQGYLAAVGEMVSDVESVQHENFEGTGYTELCQSAYDWVIEMIAPYFTEEEIRSYATIPVEGTEGPNEEEIVVTDDPLTSNDGSIVAVTYGEKKADGTFEIAKIFILNYNNFGVKVEYQGVTYSIPAEDYVMIVNN